MQLGPTRGSCSVTIISSAARSLLRTWISNGWRETCRCLALGDGWRLGGLGQLRPPLAAHTKFWRDALDRVNKLEKDALGATNTKAADDSALVHDMCIGPLRAQLREHGSVRTHFVNTSGTIVGMRYRCSGEQKNSRSSRADGCSGFWRSSRQVYS